MLKKLLYTYSADQVLLAIQAKLYALWRVNKVLFVSSRVRFVLLCAVLYLSVTFEK